jgi:hypothetical protein
MRQTKVENGVSMVLVNDYMVADITREVEKANALIAKLENYGDLKTEDDIQIIESYTKCVADLKSMFLSKKGEWVAF